MYHPAPFFHPPAARGYETFFLDRVNPKPYMPRTVNEILPNLYLSCGQLGRDPAALKHLGITHIVNCAAIELPPHPGAPLASNTLHLPLSDTNDGTGGLRYHLNQAIPFITMATSEGNKCLIHCQEGVNRAPTVTTCYLMLNRGYSLADAFRLVRQQRPVAYPNIGYWAEMIEMEGGRTVPLAALELHQEVDQLDYIDDHHYY